MKFKFIFPFPEPEFEQKKTPPETENGRGLILMITYVIRTPTENNRLSGTLEV
jgi:hypothetical protein